MERYRIRRAGWFMGRYYDKDAELLLNDKQAKYGLLSGQLEAVNPPPLKSLRPTSSGDTPDSPTIPAQPKNFQLPRPEGKPVRDKEGEFSRGRRVGGTFGGTAKK